MLQNNLFHPFKSLKSLTILVMLITAGLAGTFFGEWLFTGANYLFGSIAIVIVVRLYGVTWGVVTAVVAGGYAFIHWKQPVEIIAFTLEAMLFGWLFRNEKYQFESIIAGIGDGISVQDSNFKILYQNRIHQEMIGEHVGEYCYIAYEQQNQPCDGCPVLVSLKDGEIHRAERSVVINSKNFDIEITASPLRDATGEIVAAIEVVRDITERKVAEAILYQQSAAMRASMDGIAILGEGGVYNHINNAFIQILECEDAEQILGKNWMDFLDEVEQQRFKNIIKPELYKARKWRGEVTGKGNKGTVIPLEVSLSMIKGGGVVCVVRDITELKLTQQEIWEEKERAQVTLHSIGEGVITTDGKGNVEYLNPAAEELTGWLTAEAKGLPLLQVFKVVDESTGANVVNPVEICINERRVVGMTGNVILIRRDETKFAIEDSAAPIKNRCGEIIGAVLVFRDVTEERNLLRKIIYQANHDPLTELPNRIFFSERLTHALVYAKQKNEMLAVFFLDLDRFKLINDTLGHAAGDRMLQEVAKRLSNCLRKTDIISRVGGDEFTLLLPNVSDIGDVTKIAQVIQKILQVPWVHNGQEFYITTSIGIAIYPNDGVDPDTLLRYADTAMYRAKDRGGDNYQLYAPSMDANIMERR